MSSLTTMTTPAAVAAGGTARRSAVDFSDIGDPTKTPDHDVSFSDVLSALNPLQYIPVVSSIYRAVTGDTIAPAAQVIGGALLGGPLGLVASAANAIFEQSTGKGVGDTVVAWLTPDSSGLAKPSATQYAAAEPPQAAAAAVPTPAEATAKPPADSPAKAGTPAQGGSPAAIGDPAPAQPEPAAAPAGRQPVDLPRPAAAAAASGAPPAGVARNGSGTSKGWTLTDYRGFAGHGMPPPAGANGATLRNTPVPLQTTVPMPGETVHAPVVPPVAQTPANVAPAAAAPAPQPQDTWVSQAMMRGLDRYREMMRQEQGRSNGQPASQGPE